MDKVYVLTIESQDLYGMDALENLVFGSLEKAKKQFNKIKEEFIKTLNGYEEEDIVEEDELYYLWYKDGNYVYDHYLLRIQEKEIL